MIRELANRLGSELILSTATADGLVTTLEDSSLRQHLPHDADNVNFWVHCIDGHASNEGLERRAKSWAEASAILSLYSPGFPEATALGDTFEIHRRTQRSRKLEAINAAVRELNMGWLRPVVDTSLETVAGQYRYTAPAVPWVRINRVQIEAATSDATAPYLDLYDWDPEESVDTAGLRTLTIQLGGMVPAGRTLRIFGDAYFEEASTDASVIPLSGRWGGVALEWIYDWAIGRLMEWEGLREPATYAGRYDAKGMAKLEEARETLIRNMQVLSSGRLGIPGRGTASAKGSYGFLDVLRIEP
jgi:hypothetical protein